MASFYITNLAHQCLLNAEQHCKSAENLIRQTSPSSLEQTYSSFGLLVSHALELALKSYLLSQGQDQNSLNSIGHNLQRTWTQASNAGLSIAPIAPDWLQILSFGHTFPFHYVHPSKGTLANTPDINKLTVNIQHIINLIKGDNLRRELTELANKELQSV